MGFCSWGQGWFGYRQRIPTGRRSSPLDNAPAELRWYPSFTTDLLQIIMVLTLLSDLELAQDTLLGEIVAAEQITVGQLVEAGTFPIPSSARKPASSAEPGGEASDHYLF
jgi:hypothetical protein